MAAKDAMKPPAKTPTVDTRQRCFWATTPAMIAYHDAEWGVPQHDDRVLFEFLILEGAQAGLSWSTILAKREAYRRAFSKFNPKSVARYDAPKLKELMANEGIVRNRLKISATVQNASAFLAVQKEFGSFDAYIWQFVNGSPIVNALTASSQLPARTEESDKMSRDLLKRGFKFVGPTICYAFMQAVGMVNDHLVNCFRYKEIKAAKAEPKR
jgi:DNA-3-methyladenine glycosylase I